MKNDIESSLNLFGRKNEIEITSKKFAAWLHHYPAQVIVAMFDEEFMNAMSIMKEQNKLIFNTEYLSPFVINDMLPFRYAMTKIWDYYEKNGTVPEFESFVNDFTSEYSTNDDYEEVNGICRQEMEEFQEILRNVDKDGYVMNKVKDSYPYWSIYSSILKIYETLHDQIVWDFGNFETLINYHKELSPLIENLKKACEFANIKSNENDKDWLK